jgi:hypothetical protein
MESKIYTLILEQNVIGTTELEKADAPMGIVFGKINFINIKSGFEFFKEYCEKNKIEFEFFPEDKLISTRYIPNLRIVNEEETEIVGMGNCINGMDNDIYEINIEGIPYPFYEKEFPKHVEEYKNQFS